MKRNLAVFTLLLAFLSGCATSALTGEQEELSAAYYNLGNTYLRLGSNREAVRAYRRALEINPNFHEASLNLAYAHTLADDHTSALRVLSSLLEKDPENTLLLKRKAWSILQDQRAEEALGVYREAARIDPGDSSIRETLLSLYLELGELNAAREEALWLLEYQGIRQNLLLKLHEIDEQLPGYDGMPWLLQAWERQSSHEETAGLLFKRYLEEYNIQALADMLSELADVEYAVSFLKKYIPDEAEILDDILAALPEESGSALRERISE